MMDKQNSAVKTLEDLGYTYNGGELWKPPIGKAPDFNLIDKLNARIKELEVEHQQTEMSLDEAKKYAWEKVVPDCGLSHATVRELCNDHAFFNHGWNYATQYQHQTNKSKINEIKAQGSTGIMELGVKGNPFDNKALQLDFNVKGYNGERKGITASIYAQYNF